MLETGDNQAALLEQQIAYPAYRTSIEAPYNLAITALRLGDFDSASLYLKQTEASMPANHSGSIHSLPSISMWPSYQIKQGQPAASISYFQKVLELDPERQYVFR